MVNIRCVIALPLKLANFNAIGLGGRELVQQNKIPHDTEETAEKKLWRAAERDLGYKERFRYISHSSMIFTSLHNAYNSQCDMLLTTNTTMH